MSDTPETTDPGDLHHLDDVKVGSIVYWGFVSVAITLLALMFLHALYGQYFYGQLETKSFQNKGDYEFARTEIARQEGVLHAAPGWADKEQTRRTVPIDRAIALTLEEYNNPSATETETEGSAAPAVTPPTGESPAAPTDESTEEEPTEEESPADEPPAVEEEPATEEEMEEPAPATEEPATEEPATEEPSSEEPAAEEPATEEPATEEPSSEEPASDEPATDDPTTEEPTTDEPPAR